MKQEDYQWFDFDKSCRGRHRGRLDESTIRVCATKSKLHAVYFNHKISEEIKGSKLTRMRIRVDLVTGDMHPIFNKDRGATVNIKTRRVQINNKELVEFLMDKMGKEYDENNHVLFSVHVSPNMSNSQKFLTYKILNN